MVGWKSLFRSLSGKAAKEEVPAAAPVHELLDTSWSGKDRSKYFESLSKEGSRSQPKRHYDGGGLLHHSNHRPSRPPRHALGQADQPGAGPVAVCSRELAARLENLAQQPCVMTETEKTPPSPRGGVQRSGSAPQCILSSGKRPVEGGDSANSIHGPMPGATEEAGGMPSAPAKGAARAAPHSAGSMERTGPDLPTTHLRCRTAKGPPPPPQQLQQPVRRASHGQLSAALSECAPAGSSSQQAAAAVVAGSPEKPSEAILSTLSRSMPSSRDASVHGGQGGLAGMAGGADLSKGRQHQQRDREGSVASGSGRPASQPLPCSREGSQHGQRSALVRLAALPPGDPADGDAQLQTASMPARGVEDLVCSPGAVSLLSLQLRGISAANSVGASREGSYRPLTRQLSAGGLSVALSREGSNRAGSRNTIVAVHQQHWSCSGGYPRSREASGRDRSAYLQLLQQQQQQQQAEPEGWQGVAYSHEGSNRGGFEGSNRGYMSREGSLHPVAEAEPYRALHPPLAEGTGSWTRRITSYPMAAPPGAAPLVVDRSGSRRSNGSSKRQDTRVKQQAYAVDPTQLTAALSALALAPASVPPPPEAQPVGEGSTSKPPSTTTSGGSERGGRKSVLVGDPEWATQEGECLESSAGLPQDDLLTVCPSEVQGSQQAQQGTGRGRRVVPAGDGSAGSGEEEVAAEEQLADSAAHHAAGQHGEHAEEKKDWNRKFIRRWKAVKKRARIQAMGLRSLWKVNSPSDVHIPDELLVDLPQNDLAGRQRFWHSPPSQHPSTTAGPSPSRGVPMACSNGSRSQMYRDPSLSTMLFGEVAEVT